MRQLFDVYISYRIEYGKTYAKDLYRYLTSHGIRVFMRDPEIYYNYYPNEIQRLVKCTPHFVLIATRNVFPDHNESDNEKIDCVLEEIIVACKSFNEDGKNRTIHVLNEDALHYRPEHTLPKYISAIAVPTWQTMSEQGNNRSLFNRVLNDILEITRINVWYSAHRWYENHRRNNEWFKNNASQNLLLPNAEIKTVYEIAGVPNKPIDLKNRAIKIESRQLFELLNHSKKNIFLIGERKIGKTTVLMSMMENAYQNKSYDSDAQIPIFVELGAAPATYCNVYKNGFSCFIRLAIYRQIKGVNTVDQNTKVIDDSYFLAQETVDPILELLSDNSTKQQYLLLLDGLNTVSLTVLEEIGVSVYWMILREIEFLIDNCSKVRIVLASRSEIELDHKKIERIYLTGVNEKNIYKFLVNEGILINTIDKLLADNDMLETLQNPEALISYAKLYKNNKECSLGTLLCQILGNEGTEWFDCFRTKKIDEKGFSNVTITCDNTIAVILQQILLYLIIPEISSIMVKYDRFFISAMDFETCLVKILSGTIYAVLHTSNGFELLSDTIKNAIKNLFVTRFVPSEDNFSLDDLIYLLIDYCTIHLGIIRKDNEDYYFNHNYYRDYFTAVKSLNLLQIAFYLVKHEEIEKAKNCIKTSLGYLNGNPNIYQFLESLIKTNKYEACCAINPYEILIPCDDEHLWVDSLIDFYCNVNDLKTINEEQINEFIKVIKSSNLHF